MIPKYTVEYALRFRRSALTNHYSTDDPVTCEEFVADLLDKGLAVRAIKHEGVDLPAVDFDRLVRNAVNLVASKKICVSLGIKAAEEQFRFGFAA
jgi:hypothetical protein